MAKAKTGHLAGVKLVLTGDFSKHSRDEATALLEAAGADVAGSVSGKTMAVIAGKKPGANKLSGARERNLPVLDEAQLWALLGGKTLDEVVVTKAVAAAPSIPFPDVTEPPRDGEYVKYAPGTERVVVRGAFKDGLRHGSWKTYHDNGQLQQDYQWERGRKHGHELDWHDNGQADCVGVNKDGFEFGTWNWFHANGKPSTTQSYLDGKLDGEYKYYDDQGTLQTHGRYVAGDREGVWVFGADDEGSKTERGFLHGYTHGRDRLWHHNGKLAYDRTYHMGQLEGVEERFDDTGKRVFRGEWRGGHPVGEHVAIEDGKETRTLFIDGLPEAVTKDEKRRAKVLKAIKKARSAWDKEKVLGADLDGQQASAYLLFLWRRGDLDVPKESELIEVLLKAKGLVDGKDFVKLVSSLKADEYSAFPGWSSNVDRIAVDVYRRDPQPIDAAKNLPAHSNLGVAFLRARFGQDVGDALKKALPILVAQHAEQRLDEVLWPDSDGNMVEQKLYSDYEGTQTPVRDKLLALFGTRAEWVAALRTLALKEAKSEVGRVSFATYRDVIETASPDEVAFFLAKISLDNNTADLTKKVLTVWRHDDAATMARIAIEIKDDGLRKWPAVSCAISKHAAEGLQPKQQLLDALELTGESPTYSSDWQRVDRLKIERSLLEDHVIAYRQAYLSTERMAAVGRTQIMLDALKTLPEATVREIIERTMKRDYGYALEAAQYLHLVRDPALWEQFLDLAEKQDYGHKEAVMYGVGELGLAIVPSLVKRLAAAGKLKGKPAKQWKAGYQTAILVALARASMEGGFPEEMDALVQFDTQYDMVDEWRHFAPFAERILWRLPTARAEAILRRNLPLAFARTFALLPCAPTTALLGEAYQLLLKQEKSLDSDGRHAVKAATAALRHRIDWVRWFKQAGGGAGVGSELDDALSSDEKELLEKSLAASGVEAAAEIDAVERLRLKVEEAGGGDERIYVLRRLESDDDDAELPPVGINRVGGPAPGVDAARWPAHADEPMAHLFTLDVTTMPELKKKVGKDVVAVSVFCWHPDMNDAYESGNDQTAVVMTTKKQLDAGGSPPEEAELRPMVGFEVVAIDVDSAVWSAGRGSSDDDDYDDDDGGSEPDETQAEIYKAIYGAKGRVLGKPIWLQSAEGGSSGFLMQFDEGFCHMNLGDCGVMYVYTDGAFWQCH